MKTCRSEIIAKFLAAGGGEIIADIADEEGVIGLYSLHRTEDGLPAVLVVATGLDATWLKDLIHSQGGKVIIEEVS